MYSSLVSTYVNHWRKFLLKHSLGLEWLKTYPIKSSPATESVSAVHADDPLEVDEDEDEDEPDSENPTNPEFEEKFGNLLGN